MANIPIIDISSSDEQAARELLAAARDNGFAYIKNNHATGISVEEIQHMFDLSASFFASPTEVKEECSIHSNKSGKNRGWLGMHAETLDPGKQKKGDFKEAFNFSPHNPPQALSGPLVTERSQLLTFRSKCHSLCQHILRLFAIALSIPPPWFENRHDISKGESGSILRMLYYPCLQTLMSKAQVQSSDSNAPPANADTQTWQAFDQGTDVRAGAHSDYGSVTLLFQQRGQPGLEILTKEGEWAPVPIDPASDGLPLPILLNIGDLLSYWTNGLLKSTVHRVIFPKSQSDQDKGRDRYSMAYFCHPLDSAELVSVPSEMVREMSGGEEARREMEKVRMLGGLGDGGAEEKKVVTAKDHLDARLGATYGVKT